MENGVDALKQRIAAVVILGAAAFFLLRDGGPVPALFYVAACIAAGYIVAISINAWLR